MQAGLDAFIAINRIIRETALASVVTAVTKDPTVLPSPTAT